MQRIGIGLAALVLTLTFIYLRFPYERVAERIEFEVERRTRFELRLTDLGPRPTLLGPGVAAGPVHVRGPGLELALDALVIRPAFSPAWLTLSPAFHLSARATGLQLEGTLTLGSPPHFEGALHDTDPKLLLGETSSLELSGRLQAELDLALGSPAPAGPLAFQVDDGVLGHPLLPIQIPFERLEAELTLDPGGSLTLHRAELHSPMLRGEARGTVGRPPGGVLDVNLDLVPADDARALFRAQGMRPGRDGKISLHLGGSVAQPTLR